ncbi:MAG: LytTR family transcriptional regulator DNA-binding domain-containing protein [Prevotella sp.]|nr:LytTR family transcriptional regulator DNA-binding domain-containing protein [Prevotella sp.]
MAKIIFNTRDELIALEADNVAIVQASGNYSHVILMNKREITITMGISKVENALKNSKHTKSTFIRIGRSMIINHSFLQKIDVLKQMITLSDAHDEIRIKVAKKSLKSYKDAVVKSIQIKNNMTKKNNETDNDRNRGEPTVQDN